MAVTLSSPAFGEGAPIPARYTCDGENISPPLSWSGAPQTTQSFALVCSDPDAPGGTWYHWGLFDLPAGTDHLDAAYPTDARVGASRQAVTDFRRTGYGGPCPPRGHGPHRYRFHLMALDVARLELPGSPDCRAVERACEGHILDETVLTGTYAR